MQTCQNRAALNGKLTRWKLDVGILCSVRMSSMLSLLKSHTFSKRQLIIKGRPRISLAVGLDRGSLFSISFNSWQRSGENVSGRGGHEPPRILGISWIGVSAENWRIVVTLTISVIKYKLHSLFWVLFLVRAHMLSKCRLLVFWMPYVRILIELERSFFIIANILYAASIQ